MDIWKISPYDPARMVHDIPSSSWVLYILFHLCKLYTAYFESIRLELMVRRGFVALRDCQNLPQVCADMCEIEISHQDEDVTSCDMKFQGLPIF